MSKYSSERERTSDVWAGPHLNTLTPPMHQRPKTSSRIPQQNKGSVLISSSQTHVQILGDIRSQQVPVHNSCCCCDSPALKLPWGAWCQSWFGFVTHPVLHFCKVCYGRNETWQRKGWGGKKKLNGVFLCVCVWHLIYSLDWWGNLA